MPRALLAVAALLGGCAPPEEPLVPPDPSFHLLSSLRIAEAIDGRSSGLDLDGVASSGEGPTCVDLTPDFVSIHDPAEDGVDNAFSPLVPQLGMLLGDECPETSRASECLGAILADRIARGELLFVVEVRGHDRYGDDPALDVVLHEASTEGPLRLLADGTLAPDQQVALAPRASSTEASLAGGVLRARFEAPISITIDTPDVRLVLPLAGFRIEAPLWPGRPLEGVIAGGLDMQALQDSLPPTCGIAGCDPPLRSPLWGLTDLAPRPDDPTQCTQLSIAIEFASVPAAPL